MVVVMVGRVIIFYTLNVSDGVLIRCFHSSTFKSHSARSEIPSADL